MASALWQRRQFLKAVGMTAASLPFFSLLESSVVEAAPSRPMRLLLLYAGYGGIWDGLRPRGLTLAGGEAALTADSVSFSGAALAPLAPWVSKTLVLEGLSQTTGLITNDAGDRTLWTGHDHTAGNVWTGSTIPGTVAADAVPLSASLDFALGQKLGAGTAVRNIQLGLGGRVADSQLDTVSFNDSGARQPGFGSAADTLRVLFGTGGTSTGSDPAALAKKTSVLHAIQASATRLRSRLAAPERLKLDEHLAALADVETRLNNTAPSVVCDAPAAPGGGSEVISSTRDQFALVREAFACDRTRFVTAAWNVTGDPIPGVLDASITDMHGQVAHGIDVAGDVGAAARANMVKVQTWHAQKLADFMNSLAQTPDGSGTLLDNTLIVWSQDFGQDVHGGLNVPFVLLGGAQAKFRMGRYLRVATPYDNDFSTGTAWQNYVPHNKLLVAIMNAFGVDGTTFGSSEVSGALAGLV